MLALTLMFAVVLSEVYKGRHRRSGSIVALKKILLHNEKDGVGISLLKRPCWALRLGLQLGLQLTAITASSFPSPPYER